MKIVIQVFVFELAPAVWQKLATKVFVAFEVILKSIAKPTGCPRKKVTDLIKTSAKNLA